MRRSSILVATTLLVAGCFGGGRSDNSRAKERIFAAHPAEPLAPWQLPIDAAKLAEDPALADHVLGMGEAEAARRLGSFTLRGTLHTSFRGPGQTLSLTEDRLVEQSSEGDVHLRLLESSGSGMELLLAKGALYGRSRYGPFVQREVNDEFSRDRDLVWGALGALYLEADRAFHLAPAGERQVAGRRCERYEISLGEARPPLRPERFEGRLDDGTSKRFAFLHGRRLEETSGDVCVDRESGVVLAATLDVRWTASGDAGTAHATAELSETLRHVGEAIAIEEPSKPLPPPRRPRGPAGTLARFGFAELTDGGTPGAPSQPAAREESGRQKN